MIDTNANDTNLIDTNANDTNLIDTNAIDTNADDRFPAIASDLYDRIRSIPTNTINKNKTKIKTKTKTHAIAVGDGMLPAQLPVPEAKYHFARGAQRGHQLRDALPSSSIPEDHCPANPHGS